MMFGPSKAELIAVLLTPTSLQRALLQWEQRAQHTHCSHHRLLGKLKVKGLASKADDKLTTYLQDRPCAYSEVGSLW